MTETRMAVCGDTIRSRKMGSASFAPALTSSRATSRWWWREMTGMIVRAQRRSSGVPSISCEAGGRARVKQQQSRTGTRVTLRKAVLGHV